MRIGHRPFLVDGEQNLTSLVACERAFLGPAPDPSGVNVFRVEGPDFPHLVPPEQFWSFLPHEFEAIPDGLQSLIFAIEIFLVLNLGAGSRTGIKLRLSSETGRSSRSKLPLLFRALDQG